jgi:hypothetical protein
MFYLGGLVSEGKIVFPNTVKSSFESYSILFFISRSADLIFKVCESPGPVHHSVS